MNIEDSVLQSMFGEMALRSYKAGVAAVKATVQEQQLNEEIKKLQDELETLKPRDKPSADNADE